LAVHSGGGWPTAELWPDDDEPPPPQAARATTARSTPGRARAALPSGRVRIVFVDDGISEAPF
jgi:hypothetical protein